MLNPQENATHTRLENTAPGICVYHFCLSLGSHVNKNIKKINSKNKIIKNLRLEKKSIKYLLEGMEVRINATTVSPYTIIVKDRIMENSKIRVYAQERNLREKYPFSSTSFITFNPLFNAHIPLAPAHTVATAVTDNSVVDLPYTSVTTLIAMGSILSGMISTSIFIRFAFVTGVYGMMEQSNIKMGIRDKNIKNAALEA